MSKANERPKTDLSAMSEMNKQVNDDLYAINKSKKLFSVRMQETPFRYS